jgi:Na+/melibiose symporter-like transporter
MVNGQELGAILFAGTLLAGTLIVLLSPIIYKLVEEQTKLRLYLLLALVIGVMAGSLFLVFLALSQPLFFLPFAILVAGLRFVSPTFLYRSVEFRFEERKWWVVLRVLLAIVFLGFAGYIVYTLILEFLAPLLGPQSAEALFVEQLLMAVGGAFVVVRILARVLPEAVREKPTVWIAAILISVSFSFLAPFAFPEGQYVLLYRLSGLAGWVLGFVMLWKYS